MNEWIVTRLKCKCRGEIFSSVCVYRPKYKDSQRIGAPTLHEVDGSINVISLQRSSSNTASVHRKTPPTVWECLKNPQGKCAFSTIEGDKEGEPRTPINLMQPLSCLGRKAKAWFSTPNATMREGLWSVASEPRSLGTRPVFDHSCPCCSWMARARKKPAGHNLRALWLRSWEWTWQLDSLTEQTDLC